MKEKLKKIDDCIYEYPKEGKMNVPAWMFLSKKLLDAVEEGALQQVINIAHLPGIYSHSIAMPDMHFGYGFPIGGVAALDYNNGGLSPGGIGFDINCGVRLLRTDFSFDQMKGKIKEIIKGMSKNVPSGLGSKGKIRLTPDEIKNKVLEQGSKWAIENGYGRKEDLEFTESNGCIEAADSNAVFEKALKRGAPQLGSLGSGNHFLEIQKVDKIYLPEVAKTFGIEKENQICIMIHTGSRGLGHQVCSDYLRILEKAFKNEISKLPDRELVYAPSGTKECDNYFKAMSCAANYAWCNRQMIMHWIRQVVKKVMGTEEGLDLVYDVAHNIGKVEEHEIDGKKRKVYMHRKGATRAFPPGHPEIPQKYRKVGQPIILPGSMGTSSYVLVGTKEGKKSFFSTAHGAGRVLSRRGALKKFRGEAVKKRLESKGITVEAASWKGLAEEAPEVYKDVDEVANVSDRTGIAKKVIRLVPLGVIKG